MCRYVCPPSLLVYLHKPEAFFEIARLIGTPMKADNATTNLWRPSVARVCVEVDVSKDLPTHPYIQSNDFHFFQQIDYEDTLAIVLNVGC